MIIINPQNAYRAELIAIRQALRCAVPTGTQPVVIFTDSLTAMYNAIKYWERPHMLRHHHELPIIEEIVRLASRLGGGVSLVKVRAHTGVPGNEIADAAAGLAAAGSEDNTLEDFGVNAVCTHLGCVVPWNKSANKFCCPCHGSQYDKNGKVRLTQAGSCVAIVRSPNFRRNEQACANCSCIRRVRW